MTAEQFRQWLADAQSAGIIKQGHGHMVEAAALLGMSRKQIHHMAENGTARLQTDLACAALLNGIEPYPSKLDRSLR